MHYKDKTNIFFGKLSDPGVLEKSPLAGSRPELPADFDFQKDFRRLVKEAHQAGFTQVYPEQLLSPQEIARANAAAQQPIRGSS